VTTTIKAFRDEFGQQAAKPVFRGQQTTGLSFGQYTQWFDLTPITKPYTLAGYFKFNWSDTGTMTTVSGADQLDAVIQQVEVAPSSGMAPRSKSITRKGMEDIEQVTFDTNYSYPRTAVSTTTGTFTPFLYVPIGGEAAAVRFLLAASTAAFSGGTVTINSVTAYSVEGDSSTVVSFNEQNTPSLGSSLQDMSPYISKNITPDMIILEGETTSTVTQVFMAGQNNQIIIAATDIDAASNGAIALSPITGSAKNGLGLATQQVYPSIFQVNFTSATTHDVLEIQWAGGTSNVPQTPQVTPAPPATGQVGVVNAAGRPVPASGGPGISPAIRRPRF
jgi:hypothetical protein